MPILPPTDDNLRRAAAALREGALVGLPTETVYGIAALASDGEAVRRTFVLKGRPRDNPLIVHLADADDLSKVAVSVPESALRLADAFWPGPLTLVLPKAATVSEAATAGLDTVAVRVPNHPVALALIRETGSPLTAPSANLFMGLSPTRAEEISPTICDGLACVLDGGPCSVGVESTVVDLTGSEPRILRPGGVSRARLEEVLGKRFDPQPPAVRRAPGMYPRHYAPQTPLRIVPRLAPEDAGITFESPAGPHQIRLPRDADAFASSLYSTLYRLDRNGYPALAVEEPPDAPEWEAVWDRLRKASA